MSWLRRDRSVHRRRSRRQKNPEMAWGEPNRCKKLSPWVLVLVAVVVLLPAGVIGILLWPEDEKGHEKSRDITAVTDLHEELKSAESVARAFLAETDPAKRLQWVRDAEAVEARMAHYPQEALSVVGEIENMLGHQTEETGGRALTAFVVAMPSGDVRLLEVVATEDGPKVDWDAYARYGTASWEDLLSGRVPRAMVRVFGEPSTERPEPFAEREEWTGFRLSSPDLPQVVLGFVEVGTVREEMMKRVILGSPRYRQRFVLEIEYHAGEDEPLFEITRCLAVGWIVGERDVEEIWQEVERQHMDRQEKGTGMETEG